MSADQPHPTTEHWKKELNTFFTEHGITTPEIQSHLESLLTQIITNTSNRIDKHPEPITTDLLNIAAILKVMEKQTQQEHPLKAIKLLKDYQTFIEKYNGEISNQTANSTFSTTPDTGNPGESINSQTSSSTSSTASTADNDSQHTFILHLTLPNKDEIYGPIASKASTHEQQNTLQTILQDLIDKNKISLPNPTEWIFTDNYSNTYHVQEPGTKSDTNQSDITVDKLLAPAMNKANKAPKTNKAPIVVNDLGSLLTAIQNNNTLQKNGGFFGLFPRKTKPQQITATTSTKNIQTPSTTDSHSPKA